MSTKMKVLIAAIALLSAFAFGRWSSPEKIKIEKQIVEVEKKTSNKDAEKNTVKTTTVVKITHPDGSVEERTTIVEETNRKSSKTETVDSGKNTTEVTEESRGGSKVSVSALAGLAMDSRMQMYGVSISKPILGPVTAGAFYLTPSVLGVSLGLTF